MRTFSVVLVAASLAAAAPVEAQYTTFSGRALFDSFLSTKIVDDFSAPGYTFLQSDAAMSAVRGETRFTSTAFSNLNLVNGGAYCAGCNGSFLMNFVNSSLSSGAGVFGVGFDVNYDPGSNYVAYATFGDGSTANLGLGAGVGFFGLTSSSMIASIHLGLQNGGSSTGGYTVIDNLTLGRGTAPVPQVQLQSLSNLETAFGPPSTTVPEPASVALMAAGMMGLGLAQWRRRRRGSEVASGR
jgi:hypothetical protein